MQSALNPIRQHRKWFGYLPVLAVAVLITACSGPLSDSNDESATPAELDQGFAPRQLLSLIAPATRTLDIISTTTQTVMAEGQIKTRSGNARYRLSTSLSKSGEIFETISIRESMDISSSEALTIPEDQGYSRIQYNERGERLSPLSQDSFFNLQTLDTFALPSLLLSPPAQSIGVGATWTDTQNTNGVITTTTAVVESLTADAISVSKTQTAALGDETNLTSLTTMAASYSLPSLLLVAADITIDVRYENQLYINGVKQPVIETIIMSQTIREAGQ